jgi:ribosome-associated protein
MMVSHSQLLESDSNQENSPQKPDRSVQIAKKLAFLAHEKKAENVTVLDVAKLTSLADCFVLCTAGSERQAQAIARHLTDTIKQENVTVIGVEGLLEGHWILVDLGDVVFHVFTNEAREYYDLDGLWADAPVIASLRSDEHPSENSFMSAQ